MIQPPYYHYRPHPWHGLDAGTSPPDLVNAYIEITPFDLVKYEVDKRSGFLRVDRPQRTSSTPPTLYGFIPKTLCGSRVAKVGGIQSGDNDPLDICVLSERPIDRVEVILETRVLGGLLMEDNGQADDKIVAVLKDDAIWSEARDISDLSTWSASSFKPVMYVPAQPMPASPRSHRADQKPSATSPNSRCAKIVQPTPNRYTRRASMRSVSVTSIGTAAR